jgi:hypothetical protein
MIRLQKVFRYDPLNSTLHDFIHWMERTNPKIKLDFKSHYRVPVSIKFGKKRKLRTMTVSFRQRGCGDECCCGTWHELVVVKTPTGMKTTFYPVIDRIPLEVYQQLGFERRPDERVWQSPSGILIGKFRVIKVQGIMTGEYRNPRAGEWYLSGAIPEVYLAKVDLSTPFHICQLVLTKTESVTTIIQTPEEVSE